MPADTLILASASPRRTDLLTQICVPHTCDPADIDERVGQGEAAADYVVRMAREKAQAVALRYEGLDCAVLAADTIVEIDGDILGKPRDHSDALAILARLSGREHRVMTSICVVYAGNETSDRVETWVEFVPLSSEECAAYLATDEPWDKAGAYAIQGLAGAFVRAIRGSYSNVVGLPLAETCSLLSAVGISRGFQTHTFAAGDGH